MSNSVVNETIEDHALEEVPLEARQGWLALTWNTAGIVTTLVQLFFGALVTFVAGFKIAMLAGVLVTVIGALLGWACGHIAYRTGLSSTVMSRYCGFGRKGSIISSLIFGFMIIGFLALENALLYNGFVFYFGFKDTFLTAAAVYGGMTVAWTLLTAYGFGLVSKVSSTTLVLFLLVLVYMTYVVVGQSGQGSGLLSFGSQVPAQALAAMNINGDGDKLVFAINLLVGTAGALALVDADIGRYAKSSADIGIAALVGSVMTDIIILGLGGVIMYAGAPKLVEYYMQFQGLSQQAAQEATIQSPNSIAAAFIVFGGALGAILMVLAQCKAQVLNTYSASLALSNLFDSLGWRPGRLTFVILANVVGLMMLYGHILALVNSWITILGVITTAFVGVVTTDYFIVRRLLRENSVIDVSSPPEIVNWAGVIATGVAVVVSHYLLAGYVPIEFFPSILIAGGLYALLRLTVFKPSVSDWSTHHLGTAQKRAAS